MDALNKEISQLIEKHGVKLVIDAVAHWAQGKALEYILKGSHWQGYRIMYDKLKQI